MKGSKTTLIGQRFGFLTVISEVEKRRNDGSVIYETVCDCGKKTQIAGRSLRKGTVKSCYKCKLITKALGMSRSKEYLAWIAMKNRCNSPKSRYYKNYGGRGIKICPQWINNFLQFYRDMGAANGLTLDRIDVNGDYEPSNCRWATWGTQQRNRRNNRILTYKGQSMCASAWVQETGISAGLFNCRLQRGWSIERIIETPVAKYKQNNQ